MIHCVSSQRSRRFTRPGGIAGKGPQAVTILSAVRERRSADHASAQSQSAPGSQTDPVAETRLPFAGYDRLDARQVVDGLSDHSQIELEAVESYERSHQDRQPVLDKLRYMRGREPLPGYDALSVEEIVAALEKADPATIKKVRGYERKFGNRPDVMDEVVRVHQRGLANQPASPAPAYQPISGMSVASAGGDRPEKSGRP
jgi:hypothetical protein